MYTTSVGGGHIYTHPSPALVGVHGLACMQQRTRFPNVHQCNRDDHRTQCSSARTPTWITMHANPITTGVPPYRAAAQATATFSVYPPRWLSPR